MTLIVFQLEDLALHVDGLIFLKVAPRHRGRTSAMFEPWPVRLSAMRVNSCRSILHAGDALTRRMTPASLGRPRGDPGHLGSEALSWSPSCDRVLDSRISPVTSR